MEIAFNFYFVLFTNTLILNVNEILPYIETTHIFNLKCFNGKCVIFLLIIQMGKYAIPK